MSEFSRFSRGWCSPERYVQGPGEFDNLRFYTDKFGKRLAVFIDRFLYEEYEKRLRELYEGPDYELFTFAFASEVTEELIAARTA